MANTLVEGAISRLNYAIQNLEEGLPQLIGRLDPVLDRQSNPDNKLVAATQSDSPIAPLVKGLDSMTGRLMALAGNIDDIRDRLAL